MATLKVIRKRISSVKNTQKITRAMKLVAAAKLRRAQQAMQSLRPYAAKYREVLGALAGDASDDSTHPLMRPHEDVKRVALVVLTSDRGLCGSFNGGVLRALGKWVGKQKEEGREPVIFPLGRRAASRAGKLGCEVRALGEITLSTTEARIDAIARELGDAFVEGTVHEISVLSNKFRSAMTQVPILEGLLPVTPAVEGEGGVVDRIFEPGRDMLLSFVVPRYVEVRVREAILESIAGEHAARMTAMSTATDNAAEMIRSLTLQMNRVRQAVITKELMEIIGGAEALT